VTPSPLHGKLRVWERLARIIVTHRRKLLLALVIIVPLYALRWQLNEHDGSSLARAIFLLPIVAWLILLGLILFGWLLYLIVGTRAVYFPLVMVCATAIAWLLPLPPPPLVRVFLAHRNVFETLVARVQHEQQVTGKRDICVDVPTDVKTIHWDGNICSQGLRDHCDDSISFGLLEGIILYRTDPTESLDAFCDGDTNRYQPIDRYWYYWSNGRQWSPLPDN
jgi:hypothetical protein